MKIVHLSDLHFGTHTNAVFDKLIDAMGIIAPDLIVISGDFTQNAYHHEFDLARDFLDNLTAPYLCVPGNHDIIGRNLWERFTQPYKRYKRYISQDMCPVFENDEAIIIGLNSARRMVPHWNWANGILSGKQRQYLQNMLKEKAHKWIIVTFHHPVHKADQMPIDVVVFGGHKMMQCLRDLKTDLVLTGHVHSASVDSYGDADFRTIYLSASTALSERRRMKEANGFNLITLDRTSMLIDFYDYSEGGFIKRETHDFKRW